jgi:excisionase family DNA binding protein
VPWRSPGERPTQTPGRERAPGESQSERPPAIPDRTPAETAARIERRVSDALAEIGAALTELPALVALAERAAQAGVPQRLLTVAQAAVALSLGESTVHALVRSGEIGSVKIGAARRVPVEAIDAYIADLQKKGA